MRISLSMMRNIMYVDPRTGKIIRGSPTGSNCKITFNTVGGPTIRSRTVKYGGHTTLPEIRREGYDFRGWRCGNHTYRAGDIVPVSENMSFTAVWYVINCTVTLIRTGFEPTIKTVSYGGPVHLPNTFSDAPGRIVETWVDNHGAEYAPGHVIRVTERNLTFTAKWQTMVQVILTIPNGDRIPHEPVPKGSTVKLPDQSAIHINDKMLEGWSENGNIHAPGSSVVVKTSTEFTAIVTKRYKISFQTYGGTPIPDMTVGENELFNLPSINSTSKPGKSLAGWVSDTGKTYHPGDKVIADRRSIFTAKWI